MVKAEELKKLAEAEGGYQDIEINGKLIHKGWRNCKQRWRIIKPYIKEHQTIMDIGSHYGYFAIKIARAFKTSLVWSIEAGQSRAKIQRLALQANGLMNVLLSRHKLKLLDVIRLVRSCETLDTIICLSTIHYFKKSEIPELLWALGQLAPNLIIEFPVGEEKDVAEKDVVNSLEPEYLLGQVYQSVTKIGETSSPKHPDLKRPIYLAQNFEITRNNNVSYFNAVTGAKHKLTFKDSQWKLNNKRLKYNGLNFANLRWFNLVYPTYKTLSKEGAIRYYHLIKRRRGAVTDIHPRNLIVSHNGVFPIDYDENKNQPIYGLSWQKYTFTAKKLSEHNLYEFLCRAWLQKHIPAKFNHEHRKKHEA